MPDRSKLLRSLVAVVLLVLALPLGVYLSQRKQIYKSKASSPGDCRCDGNNIICETENGFEFKGEDPSCTTGTPPVFTKEENPQGKLSKLLGSAPVRQAVILALLLFHNQLPLPQ